MSAVSGGNARSTDADGGFSLVAVVAGMTIMLIMMGAAIGAVMAATEHTASSAERAAREANPMRG